MNLLGDNIYITQKMKGLFILPFLDILSPAAVESTNGPNSECNLEWTNLKNENPIFDSNPL